MSGRRTTPATDLPLVISAASEEDRAGVTYLLADAPFKSTIWDWQFVRNGSLSRAVVARIGREVVGFNGVMRADLWDAGALRAGTWSCDFAVRLDQRRHGIGARIKAELERRSPLLMTLGVGPQAATLLARRGWVEHAGPEDFVHRRSVAAGSASPPQSGLPPAALLERLWADFVGTPVCAVVRNPDYLRWRYLEHPSATYEFLPIGPGGEGCAALLIVHRYGEVAEWVDYLGPLHDPALFAAAAAALAERCPDAAVLRCRTSWRPMKEGLSAAGWRRTGKRLKFFVKAEPAPAREGPWFLMAGDSDGELLAAARRRVESFDVRHWTEKEFLARKAEWSALLDASSADRLFMSWDWQRLWWQHFGRPNGLELRVLCAYDRHGRPAGIAPLALRKLRLFGMAARRLQPLGHIWRGPATMKTEYCEFLLRRDVEQPVAYALARAILDDPEWEEYAMQDVPVSSATFNAVHSVLAGRCLSRSVTRPDEARAWIVDTTGSFAEYLSRLSGNARRSLYGSRSRLVPHALEQRCLAADEMERGFMLLDELHARRWGKRAFDGPWADFHRELAASKAATGEVRFDVLRLDGRPVSVLYELLADGREYNVQGGFDEALAKRLRVSLGMVHVGYALERAFAEPRTERFDLLAGAGKHEYFKHRIADYSTQFINMHFVRPKPWRFAYRLRDAGRELLERRR